LPTTETRSSLLSTVTTPYTTRLTDHTGNVKGVAVSRDGHTLATASLDTTARLWETDVDTVATRICNITWPRITPRQWDQYLPGLPYQPPCP
jgi:WD40 repeat protein